MEERRNKDFGHTIPMMVENVVGVPGGGEYGILRQFF